MKEWLRRIVEDADTRAGRVFDLVIQGLIVFSLVTFSLETMRGLDEERRAFLRWSEVVIVGVFTLEYLVRVYIAERPGRFVLSFFGIVDLLAIAPYYLAGLDVRWLRALRLLRLTRVVKLARYSRAARRFHRAFLLVREELVLYLLLTGILLYFSAVGIYYFEREAQPEKFASVVHSLWWSATTLTTLGYGDIYPVTVGGKVFTYFVVLVGIGVVAVPAGLVASALGKARELEEREEEAGGPG